MQLVRSLIRDVPDYPKAGIVFKDITPVLANAVAFERLILALKERYQGGDATHIVAIESRGFIFGAALAHALQRAFVPVRKPGKLPRAVHRRSYALEYGEDSLEVHRDALCSADRAVVVDDVIATGGTARAACELVRECGATVVEVATVIELAALGGRKQVAPVGVHALLTY